MRSFQTPGRSPVYAGTAAIATSHPLATQTGLEVLKNGGNAVDAALASVAVLCVVEPHMTGIGGDCFALYLPKGAKAPVALNGSGRAPAAATAEALRSLGLDEIPLSSPHAVTVPGSIAAWHKLKDDFGTKDFGELFEPAILLAENGYPVYPRVASDWADEAERLAADEGSSQLMMVDGATPAAGTMHRQPRLAGTLRRIAAEGRDGFYQGEVAEDIVSHLRKLGGLHTLDDFAEADAEYVTPIRTAYRGVDIWECPPNGQGICALMILNQLAGWDIDSLNETDRIHLMAEATKLAYRERDMWVGDPDQVEVPVERLLSDAHTESLRSEIDMAKAGPFHDPNMPVHKDTIYLSCVDKDGNAISFINSLFSGFGSAIMTPRTGVMLHNRGRSFKLVDGHSNVIAPRKRPMHTIIPAMAMKDDKALCSFGVMGGQYQSTGQATFVTNMLDRGMDVQEALDAPRTFAYEGTLEVENTVSEGARADLSARGHNVVMAKKGIGGGQAVWIDLETGVLSAGSDPRKDGCALGY